MGCVFAIAGDCFPCCWYLFSLCWVFVFDMCVCSLFVVFLSASPEGVFSLFVLRVFVNLGCVLFNVLGNVFSLLEGVCLIF